MIVVDNFRTVLLVGLICTVWISPSFAAMCAGKADACDADDIYCHITIEGAVDGCTKDNCPATVPDAGAGFACDAVKGCCCTAGAEPCNDMEKSDIKMKACEDALLKDKPACKTTDTTGSSMSSSEGPTGGGDTPPPKAGGLECKLNATITEACSAGKACKANKDRSEVKCVEASECNEDGCTDDGCCCKMAADATTVCEIPSSGSVIFGSLQVVTLVAAALYFFPVKTSS